MPAMIMEGNQRLLPCAMNTTRQNKKLLLDKALECLQGTKKLDDKNEKNRTGVLNHIKLKMGTLSL